MELTSRNIYEAVNKINYPRTIPKASVCGGRVDRREGKKKQRKRRFPKRDCSVDDSTRETQFRFHKCAMKLPGILTERSRGPILFSLRFSRVCTSARSKEF